MNKLTEFLENIKSNLLSDEEIRSFLLYLSKEEFYHLITTPSTSPKSTEIEKMIIEHQDIIAELLSDFDISEKKNIIPKVSIDFEVVRNMMFNTLTIPDLIELLYKEPLKYLNDIITYIKNTPFSDEKDILIATMLSNKDIYRNLNSKTISSLKNFIGDTKIFLDDRYMIVETTKSDLTNEAARYIANLRSRVVPTLTSGMLRKLSSESLLWTLNEVNKGLQNIEEEPITILDFIKLTEMPFEKAILLVSNNLFTEEEQRKILSSAFPKNKIPKNIKVSEYALSLLVNPNNLANLQSTMVYQDILELSYNPTLYNTFLEYLQSQGYTNIPKSTILVFISQLVSKEIVTRNLPLKKSFSLDQVSLSNIVEYNKDNSKLNINTNLPETFSFIEIISLIEDTFYALRRAEVDKMIKNDLSIKSFYFILDYLIRLSIKERTSTSNHKSSYYEEETLDTDAKLNSKISTLSFLGKTTFPGKYYWNTNEEQIKELAKQRKGPQNSKSKDNKGPVKLVDSFFEELKPYEIKTIKEYSSVIDLITDDEGYRLDEESLLSRYNEFKLLLSNQDIPEDKLSDLKAIILFYENYLKQEYPNITLSERKQKK